MDINERVQEAMGDLWSEIVDHPLVTAIEDGSCPVDTLRVWAEQKFCVQREFASNLAVVFSRMPPTDRELRASLAGNLYGERDHSDLFLRFAAAVGLSEVGMWAARPLPATAAFADAVYRLVREGSMAEIAAAVHVGLEGVTIQHFPKVARGLREHYGHDEDALRFWTDHDEADAEHFQHGIEVLAYYARGDEAALQAALQGGRRIVELYAIGYTACWRATGDDREGAMRTLELA